MDIGGTALAFYGLGAAAVATALVALKQRLELSKAKHRSLEGHAGIARRVAALVPFYEYDERRFFCSDNAPPEIAAHRRDGFMRLANVYATRFHETTRCMAEVVNSISDLQFTGAYQVPFQYSRFVRQHLDCGAFVQGSKGVTLEDLDGNWFYDLTGSYGVNLLGYDTYKGTMERGLARVRALGPVLGPYHPIIVRLARYHTRRSHLVRFCGAYHGWWGDVQPGIGNPAPPRETYNRVGILDLHHAWQRPEL
jgi:glutamate-1-semialdehyde 2,1-aminomutase